MEGREIFGKEQNYDLGPSLDQTPFRTSPLETLPTVQGRAKLMELSLVTHVPSGPIGCAWAGHFAWQK